MDPFWQLPENATPTPWTAGGSATLTSLPCQAASAHRYKIKQRLNVLTPRFVKIDALHYNWTVFIRRTNWASEEVRKLLEMHPDLRERQEEARRPKDR